MGTVCRGGLCHCQCAGQFLVEDNCPHHGHGLLVWLRAQCVVHPAVVAFVDHAVDLLSLLLIMSALVASARLYFEHHTEGQVLAGFLNGVFWGYMVLYFLEPR